MRGGPSIERFTGLGLLHRAVLAVDIRGGGGARCAVRGLRRRTDLNLLRRNRYCLSARDRYAVAAKYNRGDDRILQHEA